MFGPLISWLSKVDPNIVLPVVFSAGVWLWHKATGKKGDALERTIKGAIGSILSEVVDLVPANVPVEQYLKTSRGYVEKYVWKALEKRGIPRNKMTEKIVNMCIEEAARELGAELAAHRKAAQQQQLAPAKETP